MMPKVPDVILHNLKCDICKHWLSCGPVRVLPNGAGSVCGRCRHFKDAPPSDQYRHYAYEALACYFRFPCKNWRDHCPKILPFKRVLEHEENCGYGSCCYTCCCHPTVLCKSDKKLDLRAAVNLEITPDEVLQYLRCSICAGYLSCAPVYVGIDGTSTCHRCTLQYNISGNPEYIRDRKFEILVDMMVFPCVFRYEGCTKMYKFGDQMWAHETECSYGASVYNRDQRWSRQKEQAARQQVHNKERGVIETLSGHIYATITPNAPLFAPGKLYGQEMFMDEFQKHQENLANRWGKVISTQPQLKYQEPDEENARRPNSRQSEMVHSFAVASDEELQKPKQLGRTDSMYATGLIDELKIRQVLKRSSGSGSQINGETSSGRTSGRDSNAGFYERDNGPRKVEYSVYS